MRLGVLVELLGSHGLGLRIDGNDEIVQHLVRINFPEARDGSPLVALPGEELASRNYGRATVELFLHYSSIHAPLGTRLAGSLFRKFELTIPSAGFEHK
jgi:hypothetical protein